MARRWKSNLRKMQGSTRGEWRWGKYRRWRWARLGAARPAGRHVQGFTVYTAKEWGGAVAAGRFIEGPPLWNCGRVERLGDEVRGVAEHAGGPAEELMARSAKG